MRAATIGLAIVLAAQTASAQNAPAGTAGQTTTLASPVANGSSADVASAYAAMIYQQIVLAYWLTAYYGAPDASGTAPTYDPDAWFTHGASMTTMSGAYYTNGAAVTNVPAVVTSSGAMTNGASSNDGAALTVSDRVPSTTADGQPVSIYSVAGGRAAMTDTPAPTTAPRR
jgi:hypothetical protein